MTDGVRCCENPQSRLRCRVNAGGIAYAVTQCKSCGYYGSKGYRAVGKKDWPLRIQKTEDLPPFDEEAFARAQEALSNKRFKEAREAINERGNPKAQEERLKSLQDDLARREAERAARAPYYSSSEWAMVRQRVMRRAQGICEGCCITPAVEVHHMTYENFGKEFMWDLRAVCRPCHERYHAPQKDRDARIRRGELPYEGPVGPLLGQIVEGLDIEGDEEDAA